MDRCEHLIESAGSTTLWSQLASANGFVLVTGIIALAAVAAAVAVLSGTEAARAIGFAPRPNPAMSVLAPLLGASLISLYMFGAISGEQGCERASLLGLVAAWPLAVAVLGLLVMVYLLIAERFRTRRVPGTFVVVSALVSVHLAAVAINLAGSFGQSVPFWKSALTVALGALAGVLGAIGAGSGLISRPVAIAALITTLLLSVLGFGYVVTRSADQIVDLQGSDLLGLAIDSPLVLAPLLGLVAGGLLPERPLQQYGSPFRERQSR